MGVPSLTRLQAAFVIGVPIAWALLLLFHPGGGGDDIYAELNGDGTRTLVVHVGTMLFIPLIALAVYLLLRGIESTAAQVSRIALIPFVVFYVSWESLQGIANGILVDQVSALPPADQGVGAALIQDFAESPLVRDAGILVAIGSIALVTAAIAAGIALRGAGGPRWAPVVFGFAGLLITAHPPPFGPTGLAIFAVAVFLMVRKQPAAAASETRAVAGSEMLQPRAFSASERVFLLGVPLAWALLLIFHPTGEGEDLYPIVRDEVTAWQIVHLGTLLFVPMMAGVVLLLLRGLRGRAALISRAAVLVFGVVYMAWEVLIGIGTGVLTNEVNGLTQTEVPIGAALVEAYTDSGLIRNLELIGTGAWIAALVAAGVALVQEAGAPRLVLALLALSALPTAWHVAPFGQAGLALFIGAVLLVLRGGSSATAPVAAGQPAST
jgi:hypothetical protein